MTEDVKPKLPFRIDKSEFAEKLQYLLGAPPILPSESPIRYYEQMANLSEQFGTRNSAILALLDRYVTLGMESTRYQVAKAKMIYNSRREAFCSLFKRLGVPLTEAEIDQLSCDFVVGSNAKKLSDYFKKYEIEFPGDLEAEALRLRLSEMRQLDALQDQVERRRDATFRTLLAVDRCIAEKVRDKAITLVAENQIAEIGKLPLQPKAPPRV